MVSAGCSGGDQGAVPSAPASASQDASQTGQPMGKPNGVEALRPKAILKKAREASAQARSVHIVATSEDTELDLVVADATSDGSRRSGDVKILTRVVDGTLYIKAQTAYWEEAFGAKEADKIGDKWVAGDLRNPKLKAWRETTLKAPIMEQFLNPQGASEVGDIGSVAGQPAVPVTTQVGTVWVATTGRPYVLEITTAQSAQMASKAQFTQWNEKVAIAAPPQKKTINLSELA